MRTRCLRRTCWLLSVKQSNPSSQRGRRSSIFLTFFLHLPLKRAKKKILRLSCLKPKHWWLQDSYCSWNIFFQERITMCTKHGFFTYIQSDSLQGAFETASKLKRSKPAMLFKWGRWWNIIHVKPPQVCARCYLSRVVLLRLCCWMEWFSDNLKGSVTKCKTQWVSDDVSASRLKEISSFWH